MMIWIDGADIKKIMKVCGPSCAIGACIWLHVDDSARPRIIARAQNRVSYAEISVPCGNYCLSDGHDMWIYPDMGLKSIGLSVTSINDNSVVELNRNPAEQRTVWFATDKKGVTHKLSYPDDLMRIAPVTNSNPQYTIYTDAVLLTQALRSISSHKDSHVRIDFGAPDEPFKLTELHDNNNKFVLVCPVLVKGGR